MLLEGIEMAEVSARFLELYVGWLASLLSTLRRDWHGNAHVAWLACGLNKNIKHYHQTIALNVSLHPTHVFLRLVLRKLARSCVVGKAWHYARPLL